MIKKEAISKFEQLNLILAYGTLRSEMYNFTRTFGEKPSEEIVSVSPPTRLQGFKLYSHESISFPYAVFTNNTEDSIVVEMLDIKSDEDANPLAVMELTHGYNIYSVKIGEKIASIYAIDYDSHKNYLKRNNFFTIPNGDWKEFVKERE